MLKHMTVFKKTLQNDTDIILMYAMSEMTEVHVMPYNKGLGNLTYCELHCTLTYKSNTADI
jgi:sialic acid synthase SpsE